MATAGDRYEERTGNIWTYAHRGDLTGLKAAVLRGVDSNMVNTVGWTPCHAAAAGGQSKALRFLVTKTSADLSITDKGGNLAVHHAAKNGHLHALRTLCELGADITKVRLSQTKGKAVHDFVADSYRKAGKQDEDEEGTEEDVVEAVGYARRQSKSNWNFGPRKTPISCAIKKEIIKDKRKMRKEKQQHDCESEQQQVESTQEEQEICRPSTKEEPSYNETVQEIKRRRKQEKRNQQKKGSFANEQGQQPQSKEYPNIQRKKNIIDKSIQEKSSNGIKGNGNDKSESDEDSEDSETDIELLHSTSGLFAALAIISGDSDSENE